jgi:hypothetical protein
MYHRAAKSGTAHRTQIGLRRRVDFVSSRLDRLHTSGIV